MVIAQDVVHTAGLNWSTLSVQIGAIAASLVSILTFMLNLYRKVEAVHVLVNSNLLSVTKRVEQLERTLRDHDVKVPASDQSLPGEPVE